MATKTEMLIEANRRGLLKGEQKSKFDEAVKRGLIKLPVEQMTNEQVSQVEVAQPQSMSDFARRSLETVQYPAETNELGAFLSGARRGMETIGQGILQRGSEVADFLGFDTGTFKGDLAQAGRIREQEAKATTEEFPVSSTVGEIAGTVAGFPVAPARIPQAIAAGGAFGAIQPSESGKETTLNIIQDAALGGLGSWAAPYIQKGFNKAQAMFSGLYKKATGADPRPEMFMPDGSLSERGKGALDSLGIDEQSFADLYKNLDQNLDPIASTRIARAEQQGIPLTTAQATQDFAQQEAEQTLRSSVSREGEAARQLERQQQEAISTAQEGFERGISPLADKETRGQLVQDALREMQTQGRKDVSELYTKARDISGTGAELDTNQLIDTIDTNIIDRPVSGDTVNTVESVMAKFGLIDGEVSKSGRFNQITDSDGKAIRFKGEQTPLNLDNAEEFRQALRNAAQVDQTGAVTQMIGKLDELVDNAVSSLPEGSEKTMAFLNARAKAREQKEIFNQKDVVQNLVSYKKNTTDSVIQPDRVIDSVLKGQNSLANMRKVKSALMSNPTNKSIDAWRSIQAQGVADIFGQSINPANGDISGLRLNSAIKRFGGGSMKEGEKRLKVLLGDRYTEFNNLVKSIGDATIPLKGTTNPSGTAYKVLNFMTRVGSVGQFGADAIIPIANKVKDAAASKRVLKQIEKASPEKVKTAVKANDELIDAYIRLGLTGTLRE